MQKRLSPVLVITVVALIFAVIFFWTNPIQLRGKNEVTSTEVGEVSPDIAKMNQEAVNQGFQNKNATDAPSKDVAPMSTVLIPNTDFSKQTPSDGGISSNWYNDQSDAAAKTAKGGS